MAVVVVSLTISTPRKLVEENLYQLVIVTPATLNDPLLDRSVRAANTGDHESLNSHGRERERRRSLRVGSRTRFAIGSTRRPVPDDERPRRNPALKEHPPGGEELPVLIVSLSYCSAVSVPLNLRLVDSERLAVNKATRRISLVFVPAAELFYATSCPHPNDAFPFCPNADPARYQSARARAWVSAILPRPSPRRGAFD